MSDENQNENSVDEIENKNTLPCEVATEMWMSFWHRAMSLNMIPRDPEDDSI